MTGRDKFPFGKPSKEGLTLDEVDEGYLAWLEKQEWWTDPKGRWKNYRAYYKASEIGEDDELVEPKEKENLDAEKTILAEAPPSFITFWKRAYGERLRKDGEMVYVAYLRVARHAYEAGVADNTALLRSAGAIPRESVPRENKGRFGTSLATILPSIPPITGDEPPSESIDPDQINF